MTIAILFFIILFPASVGYAQSDFREGYILTRSQDTLSGLIDFRQGLQAYRACNFKNSKSGDLVTYEPGQILGYGSVNDRFFESRNIADDTGPAKLVFLEIVVLGPVSLLRFENTYFAEKEGEGLHALINESAELFINDRKHKKNGYQYIAVLNRLLFDCVELRPEIQKAQENERSLTKLIEAYNRCKGERFITYKADKPWIKFLVGVSGGINVSNIEFLEYYTQYNHLGLPFKSYNSPMAGISLNLSAPRINELISFNIDVFYLKPAYYAFGKMGSATNYITIEAPSLKIPMGIQYTFPGTKIIPLLKGGISNTIHLNAYSELIAEVKMPNEVRTYRAEALPIRRNEMGYWIGGGALMRVTDRLNGFIEVRYEKTEGLTAAPEIISKIKNFQVIAGIRMK